MLAPGRIFSVLLGASKEIEDMEEEREDVEEQEKGKKKIEKKLPYCTTAPSPEHARSHEEDEPCDDGRAGDTH